MSISQQETPSAPSATLHGAQHIGALDGVRALSIILVLIAHTVPFGPGRWGLNGMAGAQGMSLFFCLSGFLIVSILHRNADAASFLIRRVLRIVPAVLLYMLIVALLFNTSGSMILENVFFVANYVPTTYPEGYVRAPISHLWSLSVEMHFYLVIGLTVLFFGKRSLWLVPVAAVIITLIRVGAGAYVDNKTHLRVDEILAGGTLALVYLHAEQPIRAFLSKTGIAAALLFLIAVLWAFSCHKAGGALMYLRPYFAATMVGIIICSRLKILHTVLESRPAAYIARISYALYIYHPLMISGWMNTGSDVERYLLKRPISYALTLAAAHISTYYWEARWQAWAHRLTSGRAPHIKSRTG